MSRLTPGTCADCDDPVMVTGTGWYRCRSCGYESLRDPPIALNVAQSVFSHWAQYEATEHATDDDIRAAASESIRQGDLFASEWARAHR